MSQPDDSPDPSPEELIDLLRLEMVSGVGPRIRRALLDRFGTPAAVLSAAPSELREVQGVGPKLTERIVHARNEIDVEGEIAICREQGVTILTEAHRDYPRALREIHDPPGVLFLRGEVRPEDGLAVAIVGTRHATLYGKQQAERLAAGLARSGVCVVSGLARGIDAAAHRGAIAAGGRTLAVLGSGVLNIYPPEHETLAQEVAAHGAVISENPPRVAPLAGMFPQRNRIISGLSQGVIVVEAGQQSGALITARHAMEQGRDVFAVPGRVDSRTSQGCHRLIRDGAKLVESVEDVLEELGPLVDSVPRGDGQVTRRAAELLLNEVEQQVLAAVEIEPTLIDVIITTTRLPVPQVLSTISVLEMRHLIRRVSGTLVARI